MFNLYACFFTFIITAFFIWVVSPLAIRIGLVDSPRGRKQHAGHVPLVGGVGIFIGFLGGLFAINMPLFGLRSFLAGGALLVLVGILDDFHELPPRGRLVAQIIVALLMSVWGGVVLNHLGSLFFMQNIVLGKWGLLLTVIAALSVINAINMIDGIDGLAGTLVLITVGFLMILATMTHQGQALQILGLVASSVVAFLLFNFRFPWRDRAFVFMGDAGSLFLGFVLVWFSVMLSQVPSAYARPVTMLWIMALPLFDIASVVLRRLQKKCSPLTADREHLHYLLQTLGWGSTKIVLVLGGVAIILGSIGILGDIKHIAEGWMFISFLAVFISYIAILTLIRRFLAKAPSDFLH